MDFSPTKIFAAIAMATMIIIFVPFIERAFGKPIPMTLAQTAFVWIGFAALFFFSFNQVQELRF